MCVGERLPASLRKSQICEVAKNIFLRKGFANTTMEDIVKETGLSKGGLYHHYKSTSNILYDLMCMGTYLRFERMEAFIKDNPGSSPDDLLIELTLMKLLDTNDYKSLYAMFLIETKKDANLKALYRRLENEAIQAMKVFSTKSEFMFMSCMINEEFIAFVNSIIVATELLDVKDTFLRNPDFFRNIIRTYISKHS